MKQIRKSLHKTCNVGTSFARRWEWLLPRRGQCRLIWLILHQGFTRHCAEEALSCTEWTAYHHTDSISPIGRGK